MTKEEQITLKDIHTLIAEMRTEMRETYVTKDSFEPVKRVTYGLVALILTAVMVSLLGMVVINSSRTNAATTSTNK